jgi:stringent starvation protein B
MDLLPQQPYFMRAVYEWLCDNDLTPQVLIDCSYDEVNVPPEYIKNNMIVFNITGSATNNSLLISNEEIKFKARIGEDFLEIDAPIYAIKAIFAKENQEIGLTFSQQKPNTTKKPNKPKTKITKNPKLKIV